MSARFASTGQVLVLFVLFLLVLLGVSAMGIDYASWLLTDRHLQNVSDHASLAGASEFDQRISQGSCSGGSGATKCFNARAKAWKSLVDELDIRDTSNQPIGDAAITALATQDAPAAGKADGTYGGQTIDFTDTIWVTTPPPTYDAYTKVGGRFSQNFGVVFVRVDRRVPSFIGGALGIAPQPRHGWATAGALPTDFALQVFCRNNVAPENGVCVNSAGVTIDGQGGIRLLRGDVGSNESLTVTSNTGLGVVVEAGNVFLVNRNCAPSTWNCPNSPPRGGISDGVTGKNAFYIAPLPVPRYESPLDDAGISAWDCAGASSSNLCIPYKDQTGASPTSPGDWTCSTATNTPVRCGVPAVSSGTVTCSGAGGGVAGNHFYPVGVASGANLILGDAGNPQSNGNEYLNVDDAFGSPDTGASPPATPDDWLYAENLNITGGGTQTVTTAFTVNLGQAGPRLAGDSTVRYTVFKTNNGVLNGGGYDVRVTVSLVGGVTSAQPDPAGARLLTDTPTRYSFDVNSSLITDYNALQLRFEFTETGVNDNSQERGGGVSWAGIQHPDPQPAVPPFIPPGYYRSIVVPDGGCAILDPVAEYSSLKAWQMPGIYRFGGNGSPNQRKVKLGDNSFLIGDGVTLLFDADWPDSGANQGVAIGANGALVLNTQRVPSTTPPCTPSEMATSPVNMSTPLGNLQYDAVCAAWAIDPKVTTGIRPGANAWPACDQADASQPMCGISRATDYDPPAGYRGITFYFMPAAWPPSGITNRFEMQGGSGNDAGLAFRGVMYAPYDDVKITGGNGFNTVGQVQAWTAKFNGGSAFINLDYPYDYTPASPYLLEPTVDH